MEKIQFEALISGVQNQLELEITAVHLLSGKAPIAIGRRPEFVSLKSCVCCGCYPVGGTLLIIASLLLVLCGIVHSTLGERYILIRLFKRENLPHIFGSEQFTKGTLRFAWHITSLAWFGFAALLMLLPKSALLLLTVSVVFALSGLFSVYYTKGKHLSWLVFFVISGLTLASAVNNG